MNQACWVSIIVNNYNYGQFLTDAIDSALGQSYAQVQVVVVDDGSTDNSREIIQRYGCRVTPVLKENGGQASAFNAGLSKSRGEIVIFLDADDVLRPETVGCVVDTFRQHPGAAKVQYRMEIIDARGTRTGIIMPAAHLPFRSGDLRPYVLTFPFDLTWMATSGNAFAVRVLRQIFPMPERDFPILADFYLAHLTPLFGPVVALDEVGAYYRVHGGNQFASLQPTLYLNHIRQLIAYAQSTHIYIRKFAGELGLACPALDGAEMQSVSLIADRLISLKLDPSGHPFHEDAVAKLCERGLVAALGRSDVSLPIRFLLAIWFAAMALAPRPVAYWLAEKFFFPETRGDFNKLLGALHRLQI